ncbi:unnamed protein product [Rhizopus stolonifer]
MSKNLKEKSSFWKKLGLGKHKASSASLSTAFHQQQTDTTSLKSERRRSSQHSQKKNKDNNNTLPPIPHGNIPKQSNEIHDDILPKSNNDTLTPTEPTQNEQETRSREIELQQEIDDLKQQLEKEKSMIDSVKKQKEAITKDLDYLGSTVDELYAEKSDLLQQLEDEKTKNERQLEDLNVLMVKMKANADNARDKSFVVDQYKSDFENHMNECQTEKKEWKKKMAGKDKEIKRLNLELDTTKDQMDNLRLTMEQLIQSHAAELSRVTSAAAAATEKNIQSAHNMNTPTGSPLFQPKKEEDLCCSPIPSNLPMPSTSTTSTEKSTDSQDFSRKPKEDIDSQLMRLTKEREKLQSSFSKIPISGGGPQTRRRKEELESMLDQVDSQLSKVKQRIRRP